MAPEIAWEDSPDPGEDRAAIQNQVIRILEDGGFWLLFQPIFEMDQTRCVAYEALCRFADGRSPEIWFKTAHEVGLGVQLEVSVLRKAVQALDALPEEISVSVNVSPASLSSGEIAGVLKGCNHERCILEITEQTGSGSESLVEEARAMQFRGTRIAVDDLGVKAATMKRVVDLRPDIIKLDRSLVKGISHNTAYQSFAAAAVEFASDSGAVVVAEGIENDGDLATLSRLGVHMGQGWLLGRPVDLVTASAQWSLLRYGGIVPGFVSATGGPIPGGRVLTAFRRSRSP